MGVEYLVEKYSKLIYKICLDMLSNSLDAEDATQETYIKIYKSIDKYVNLPENEIKNIICRVALNTCKDVLKSKLNKINNLTDNNIENLENYEDDNSIEEEMYKKERKIYIAKMLSELKEPYSSVLNEYYIDQLSLDDISSRRSISKATLKVQIHRGKEILKEKIKESGGDSFL